MSFLRAAIKRVICAIGDCPRPQDRISEDTMAQLRDIPRRLDQIIEQRAVNNVMEMAYLERLRKDVSRDD